MDIWWNTALFKVSFQLKVWGCVAQTHACKNLANSLSYQLNVFTLYFLLFRDLVAPGLSLNALLMKYSRSSIDASGVKIYNSKKPLWANSIAVLWLELEAFLTCRNDHSFNISLKYFRRYTVEKKTLAKRISQLRLLFITVMCWKPWLL